MILSTKIIKQKASYISKRNCVCGKKEKITFMHNCPNSSSYSEIIGCPIHDDVCPLCMWEL